MAAFYLSDSAEGTIIGRTVLQARQTPDSVTTVVANVTSRYTCIIKFKETKEAEDQDDARQTSSSLVSCL
jgi:hypothetical protein